MSDTVLARLVALKATPTPDLKQQWRDLIDSEPPPYNRRFLESRLSYRIQELTYGGLKPKTVKRLETLARGVEETNPVMRRMRSFPRSNRHSKPDIRPGRQSTLAEVRRLTFRLPIRAHHRHCRAVRAIPKSDIALRWQSVHDEIMVLSSHAEEEDVLDGLNALPELPAAVPCRLAQEGLGKPSQTALCHRNSATSGTAAAIMPAR